MVWGVTRSLLLLRNSRWAGEGGGVGCGGWLTSGNCCISDHEWWQLLGCCQWNQPCQAGNMRLTILHSHRAHYTLLSSQCTLYIAQVRCHGLGGNQAWVWSEGGGSIRHRWTGSFPSQLSTLLCQGFWQMPDSHARGRLPCSAGNNDFIEQSLIIRKQVSEELPWSVVLHWTLQECSGDVEQKWSLGGALSWSAGTPWYQKGTRRTRMSRRRKGMASRKKTSVMTNRSRTSLDLSDKVLINYRSLLTTFVRIWIPIYVAGNPIFSL